MLFFWAVLGPSISQNGFAKLSISSKNSKWKKLSGYNPEPVWEQDRQLLGCLFPVLHRLGPLLPDSRKCKIDKFFQSGIRCKHVLVLGYLAELAVVTFHGICSIYYPFEMLWVLEVSGQTFPVVTPALGDNRMAFLCSKVSSAFSVASLLIAWYTSFRSCMNSFPFLLIVCLIE